MARIRSIKPEFWTSEQITECSTNARLLFIGMWNFCDDYGVHPASVKRLKMEVFPGDTFDSATIRRMIDELLANGLITEYEVEGASYWYVTGWDRHQKPDTKTGRYPKPDGSVGGTVRRNAPSPEPGKNAGDANNDGKGAPSIRDVDADHSPNEHRTVADHSPPEKEKEKEKEVNLNPPLPPLPGGEDGTWDFEEPDEPPAEPLPTEPITSKRGRKSSDKTTFAVWLKGVKERGEKPVTEFAALWDYADSARLPHEFIELAWASFAEHYLTTEPAKNKRYADWKTTFLNAVKGNYRRLWYWSERDEAFRLTTAGQQIEIATRFKEAA